MPTIPRFMGSPEYVYINIYIFIYAGKLFRFSFSKHCDELSIMFSIVWSFKCLLEMHGSALHHRDCPYSELDYNNKQLYGEATKLFTIVCL